jgi:hypothetical protein
VVVWHRAIGDSVGEQQTERLFPLLIAYYPIKLGDADVFVRDETLRQLLRSRVIRHLFSISGGV